MQNLDTLYFGLVLLHSFQQSVSPLYLYTVPERIQSLRPPGHAATAVVLRVTIKSIAIQINSSPLHALACISRPILTNSSELHLLMTHLYVVVCCSQHTTFQQFAIIPSSNSV